MSRKPALSEFAAANESNGDLRLFFNELLTHHTIAVPELLYTGTTTAEWHFPQENATFHYPQMGT
jgi:hypothetical protein